MSITLDGTNGITTPDITSSGALGVDASAPDNSLVVDASGNVGIATNSPVAKLDVNGPASVTSFTGSTRLGVSVKGSTSATDYSGIDFSGNSQTVPTARIAVNTTGSGSYLSFGTSSNYSTGITNQAMTINQSGQVFVNNTYNIDTALNAAKFNVEGFTSFVQTASGFSSLFCTHTGAATQTAIVFRQGAPALSCGSITMTGATTTAYNTSSDYRLKENIAPMTGALAKVAQLNPVTYTWKINGNAGEGFIAHELAEVCPQAVHGEKDAVDAEGNPVYQGIDTSFLVATLTAAIQEQQAIIDALTTRIEALENPA